MRITRILKSLTLLGLREYASALFRALEDLCHSDTDDLIGIVAFEHWQRAVEGR